MLPLFVEFEFRAFVRNPIHPSLVTSATQLAIFATIPYTFALGSKI